MSDEHDVVSGIDMSQVINQTEVDTTEVMKALSQTREFAELVTWTHNTRGDTGKARAGNLFDRDRFVCPNNPIDQMRTAMDAANDDVVATFLDSSEAMAIRNLVMEVADEDEKDIWEQILEDADLEERLKEVWREVAVASQAYIAVWYEKKDFTVRGQSKAGVKRKKTFRGLTVPSGVTVLDPFKVFPVGNFLFGQETLTYYADPTERDVIDSWLIGDDDSGADGIIKRLIVGKYEPDFRDRKQLGNLGVDPNRLYILNPQYVWRITATRPSYNRFSDIRMKSIFELLDLKQQLRQSDRATLIGAANFIILIKKGTDKEPAKQFEIQNLQDSVRSLAKVPILVGDHRLNIEIITPKTDNTLNESRFTVLDSRIMTRLWGMFVPTSGSKDDSLKLARVVSRGISSRRDTIVKSFMHHLVLPTFALNDSLLTTPSMVFYPKRVDLDFDPALATYLLDLRDRGDLSRASILSEIDYDEESEAEKRKIEKLKYDAIFAPTVVQPTAPANAPKEAPAPGAPNDPKRAGRALGGNHGKGGNGNVGRGAGQPPRSGLPKDKPKNDS